MRPTLRKELSATSELFARHLDADLYLVDWVEAQGLANDVITEHDLDREGAELLQSRLPSCVHHARAGGVVGRGPLRRPRAPTFPRLTQPMGSPPTHRPAIRTRGGALRSHQRGVQRFKLLSTDYEDRATGCPASGSTSGVGLDSGQRHPKRSATGPTRSHRAARSGRSTA